MVLVNLLLIVAHASLAAVCVPLIRRRVPPNAAYGFRTPKTLSNDRVWYEANAVSGRYLLLATIVSALITVVALIKIPSPQSWLISGSGLMATMLMALVASFVA